MSAITTHVLDTSKGTPARGIPVRLYKLTNDKREKIGEGLTDSDGRCKTLLGTSYTLTPGPYALDFDVASYLNHSGFYKLITIAFEISNPTQHHHVPLLLSPFAYSTYRGS
jgi:5-hydroxyisourate hydrolase